MEIDTTGKTRTYPIEGICYNCGNRFTLSIDFGSIRPEKTECPRCGNLAETKTKPPIKNERYEY